MITIGIDHNLNRERIRKLLIIGVIGSVLTGIGTMFLSFGNLFMFGGLLTTLPDLNQFEQFEATLSLSSRNEVHR